MSALPPKADRCGAAHQPVSALPPLATLIAYARYASATAAQICARSKVVPPGLIERDYRSASSRAQGGSSERGAAI
jgi:hypothetical protein